MPSFLENEHITLHALSNSNIAATVSEVGLILIDAENKSLEIDVSHEELQKTQPKAIALDSSGAHVFIAYSLSLVKFKVFYKELEQIEENYMIRDIVSLKVSESDRFLLAAQAKNVMLVCAKSLNVLFNFSLNNSNFLDGIFYHMDSRVIVSTESESLIKFLMPEFIKSDFSTDIKAKVWGLSANPKKKDFSLVNAMMELQQV